MNTMAGVVLSVLSSRRVKEKQSTVNFEELFYVHSYV